MRNVKVILISVALCATVFANQRIAALGGDAGFWSGDRANVGIFPATINDHQFLELDGVGNNDGVDATLLWGDATKWGFNFTSADANTWFNIMWGNGDVGLNVQYMTTDWSNDTVSGELTGFGVGYGQDFDWGELGVHFSSVEDASAYGVNWRSDMDVWVFDSAKASMGMTDNGFGSTTMALSFDMYTHLDAGAADILFAMGVDYASWDVDGAGSTTWMTLPSATVAVESALNDWATLRGFVNHSYVFSCSDELGICADDAAGPYLDASTSPVGDGNETSYGFGLGFNWGSASLDMQVSEGLFTNPVGTMTGNVFDDGTSTSLARSEVTLSYTF